MFAESPESLKASILEAGGDEEVLAGSRARRTSGLGGPAAARRGTCPGALRFSFTRPQKISQEDASPEALAGPVRARGGAGTLFEREHRTAETLAAQPAARRCRWSRAWCWPALPLRQPPRAGRAAIWFLFYYP
ncbi:hypothetical protein GCM10020220_095430 [Nonomuraea rubra]